MSVQRWEPNRPARPRQPKPQCSAIVQPGEYTIDVWDGQQCGEKNPQLLTKCEDCEKYFCLMMHWPIHIREWDVLH